ncbi:MAG: molybdopterin biosynthesis protein MoeB [Robiginitomaculum sp.]|nr:MAG: molybdopterin biosynthesis protein MoeB [Robiginitomaculum sp.]
MSPEEVQRYGRQILLKEVGGPGQAALKSARVLIVGAGGLGGPASLYLAAAGVGTIGIVDDDVVELSNLHRQIQFQTGHIGQSKTACMEATLSALNPHVQIKTHEMRLTDDNARELISAYDLVLDGTDDFPTRFAVNVACLATHTSLVSGALGRFDGQLAVFKNDGDSACYRCFVPVIPDDIETCAAVGVLGALAGIIGSMMAMEALKILTGAGKPLYGKLFLYDGLSADARTIRLPKDPNCPACT